MAFQGTAFQNDAFQVASDGGVGGAFSGFSTLITSARGAVTRIVGASQALSSGSATNSPTSGQASGSTTSGSAGSDDPDITEAH